MAKIGDNGKPICFAKWLVWVKNKKCRKGARNGFTTTLELLCGKKTTPKTPSTRKRRAF